MALSFSPNGFDRERKDRAAECEVSWDRATAVAVFLGVASASIGLPIAPGFIVIGALGPVLKHPFTRIKNDPPRDDFSVPTVVRSQTIDPTLAFGMLGRDGLDEAAFRTLVAFTTAVDRTAAHLDAMVLAVERALGAYRHHSQAGIELKVAEARNHAVHAGRSSFMLTIASQGLRDLRDEIPSMEIPNDWTPADLSIGQFVVNTGFLEWFLATGADEAFLNVRISDLMRPEELTLDDLVGAADETHEFAARLIEDLPPSAREFIAEGDDRFSEHWVGA